MNDATLGRVATSLSLCLLMSWSPCCTGPQRPASPRSYADHESVRCAYQDRQQRIWFGTNHEGVWCWDGQDFTRYSRQDGLPSDHISAITEDDVGNLWFATTRGLSRYDGERFESVAIPWDGNEDLWGPGLNANVVLCLLCDRRGDVWFGTWGNGAHRFDPSRPRDDGSYTFSSFLQDRGSTYGEGEHRNAIQSIVEDHDGNVWLTSMSHGGVSRYRDGSFEHFGIEQGLGDDMVFSAHVDRRGSLWFGMLGNDGVAVAHYDGQRFERYSVADGLGSNNVVAITELRDGSIWFGSHRSALSRLRRSGAAPDDGRRIEPVRIDGRTFERIHFVFEDESGAVWFGGHRGQLFCLRDGERTDHTQKRGSGRRTKA